MTGMPGNRAIGGSAAVVLKKSLDKVGFAESRLPKIRGLIPSRHAYLPENCLAAFQDSMLREVKRAILRDRWFPHNKFPLMTC